MKALLDLVARHRRGEPVGITSVCSAHPLVLRAALEAARDAGGHALIEATANQVNQHGGYTGLLPAAFRDLVLGLADAARLPRERVLLGVITWDRRSGRASRRPRRSSKRASWSRST